jgi:hypothetical protein
MNMLVTFTSKARGTVTYAAGLATGYLYQRLMLIKTVAFHYSWRCELFIQQALHRLSDSSGHNAGGACLRELPVKNILVLYTHTRLTVSGVADFVKKTDA